MRGTSGIRGCLGPKWLRATACLLAWGWATAPALAQSEPEDAATVVALGPTMAGPLSDRSAERGLSLDVRPSLAAPGVAPNSADVGLQWRQPVGSRGLVDITAWRRSTPPTDALSMIQQREPVFGARFEFKLAARKSFATDMKFIGLQLDSGARIGIRKSNGNPTIYYRQTF